MVSLFEGDCLEVMKGLGAATVDLTVTSPPYDSLREYNGNGLQFTFESFQKIAEQLYRVSVPSGIVVWVVNDEMMKGSESGSSFKQALYFKEIGFCIHDTMIWQKISPFQHKNRYIQDFEYMFVFSKGPRKVANLIKDRKNKWAGTRVHGTERQKNGKTEPRSEIQKSKWVPEYGNRVNIWDIPSEHNSTSGHPAVFPIAIPRDHIITWTNEGDTVLDPFLGSGTTGMAAVSLNRNFIGMEKDPEYFKIASQRIKESEIKEFFAA